MILRGDDDDWNVVFMFRVSGGGGIQLGSGKEAELPGGLL